MLVINKKATWLMADEIERTLYHNGTVSSCLDARNYASMSSMIKIVK